MSTTRHNIRIANVQAGQLVDLTHTGWLIPENGPLSGMRGGQVYRPASAAQSALHDSRLQIGEVQLQAELHRLPQVEHQALVSGSPLYMSYPGAEQRVSALLSPLTRAAQRAWLDDLVRSVRVGRVPPARRPESMVWQPAGTRLVRLGDLWFASLLFAAPRLKRSALVNRVHLGIDVGLRPLAVAVSAHNTFCPGHVQRLGEFGEDLGTLSPALQAEVRAELERVQYAAARLRLAEFTDQILQLACSVTVEKLKLTNFESDFVAQGRREAIIDWHQSWLPQSLYRASLPPLLRVKPHGTSQYCSRCRRRGERDRARFTCPRCGLLDAHINAGRNLLNRGWAERRAQATGQR